MTKALRRHRDDAVLMGSPSQTGRDLWSRTVPTTGEWAGGAEVHLALAGHLTPWKVEILGGLLLEDGRPLDEWGRRLKPAWADLTNLSRVHADARRRTAARLAPALPACPAPAAALPGAADPYDGPQACIAPNGSSA
ncbi:hypothetical protein ACIBCA_20875 [Kitasatospora sp. NPDC051170]|uniref:hypothetical protein n=1 Tax=Kitasatospora sp. NPDC051170 TaxID=3364056 RepID=UPI00379D50D0